MSTEPETQQKPTNVERKTCRACGSKTLIEVLNLGTQYLCNFVDEPKTDLPQSPLNLVRCVRCGLLQLQHTVDPELVYREYWYRSGINQTMRDALKDVVRSANPFHESGAWLDIGANDGTLLAAVPDSFDRVACEPAKTFHPLLEEHVDCLIPEFFSTRWTGGAKFDVITSCAMFYDIDNPAEFVQDISDSLTDDGIWINQLNDSPRMMERNGFDAICHEHLTYWDPAALAELYGQNGLQVVRITYNEVNGGSMRVFAKRSARPFTPADVPKLDTQEVIRFADRIPRWKNRMSDLCCFLTQKSGPLWAYGASTKFSTMLQYLDQNQCFLGVADRNPAKHGRMMVGSWLPICSESTVRLAHPVNLFVGPWGFRDEFVKREAALRAEGTAMLFPLPSIEFVL